MPKTEECETLEVLWVTPPCKMEGVTNMGYAQGTNIPIGLNGILVGDLVGVEDLEGVFHRKYNAIRRLRLSNDFDPVERRRGIRMKSWATGPWRITYATEDGSFGITLDENSEYGQFDIVVRADMVTKWQNTSQ